MTMTSSFFRLLALPALLILTSCETDKPAVEANHIYYGGTIVTMDDTREQVGAVATKDGKIINLGSKEDILSLQGPNTKVWDLDGKTMLPGFIDAHSHLTLQAYTSGMMVNLTQPPVGTTTTIPDLLERLKDKAKNTPEGGWVVGFGYDDQAITELRHPTRDELDSVSSKHNVVIMHVSFHMIVVNSYMLDEAGIDRDTADPVGGIISRDSDGRADGLLQETAALLALPGFLPPVSDENRRKYLENALKHYASKGITLGQEGFALPQMIDDYIALQNTGKLAIRVVALPGDIIMPLMASGKYTPVLSNPERFALGGTKMILDGSLQGYTGFLTKPYHVQQGGDAKYRGYPRGKREDFIKTIKSLHAEGHQLIVHVNGDAATDIYLGALKDIAATGSPAERPVAIHAQVLRQDQLEDMAKLGVIPSFFNMHTYYWADLHNAKTLGPERTAFISPAKSAQALGLAFTMHSDAPVVPMEPLRIVWSAVTRRSAAGEVFGEGERIDVMTAMKAITINAARQYFREDTLGSIEVGKFADFVILNENPLTVDADHIKDIAVSATIVDGQVVYGGE